MALECTYTYSPLCIPDLDGVIDPMLIRPGAESCEKAAELTQSRWPSSVYIHVAIFASQILTVLSSDADTTSAESCEKAADWTHSYVP